MGDMGCGIWDVGCGMWDVDVVRCRCAMWDVGCEYIGDGLWDADILRSTLFPPATPNPQNPGGGGGRGKKSFTERAPPKLKSKHTQTGISPPQKKYSSTGTQKKGQFAPPPQKSMKRAPKKNQYEEAQTKGFHPLRQQTQNDNILPKLAHVPQTNPSLSPRSFP